MTTQEIIEVIKGLSVLELNDLVKACEEEFGVSAAAGVVVAAAGADGAAAAEEKDSFNVELTEVGPNKVKVSDFIRPGGDGSHPAGPVFLYIFSQLIKKSKKFPKYS